MNFDLNIDNYDTKELASIFDLPTNYDETIIDIQENKLRQNLLSDKTLKNDSRSKIIKFIENAKKILKDEIVTHSLLPTNSLKRLNQTYESVYNVDKNLKTSDTVAAGSTHIIKQPITPYGQSFPSEFYAGSLNPINKRTLRQNINIDTRFRENYYGTLSTNFHLDLPIKLTNVLSLQLAAVELPTTFYVISKVYRNNFFQLILPEIGESLMVIVPDGNYTPLSLQNYINNFLSTQPNSNFSTIQSYIDLTNDSNGSGKFVFGSTGANINFSINFLTDENGIDDRISPLPLRLGWLLGFRVGYYENSLTYVSEGIINLTGPRYLYLVIDDYNNSVNDGFYGAFSSSLLNKNILARISNQTINYNILSQNNLNLITTTRQYFGPVDIQKIQVQLLDEYGRILDLNNMDYSFCLTFQTIYDL